MTSTFMVWDIKGYKGLTKQRQIFDKLKLFMLQYYFTRNS